MDHNLTGLFTSLVTLAVKGAPLVHTGTTFATFLFLRHITFSNKALKMHTTVNNTDGKI